MREFICQVCFGVVIGGSLLIGEITGIYVGIIGLFINGLISLYIKHKSDMPWETTHIIENIMIWSILAMVGVSLFIIRSRSVSIDFETSGFLKDLNGTTEQKIFELNWLMGIITFFGYSNLFTAMLSAM